MERDWLIVPLDEAAMTAARERQARLAKPPGSLGRLEELCSDASFTFELMKAEPSMNWLRENGVI